MMHRSHMLLQMVLPRKALIPSRRARRERALKRLHQRPRVQSLVPLEVTFVLVDAGAACEGAGEA